MLFKKKKFDRKVSLTKDVVDSISTYCKIKHPNESILILKGKSKNKPKSNFEFFVGKRQSFNFF